jgi:hypothetical protein
VGACWENQNVATYGDIVIAPWSRMIRASVKRVLPVIFGATALLLLLDIIGELAGKPLGFPYPSLGVVSLLIYVGVGALGAWRASFIYGFLSATLVGLLDGTLGPLAAWVVGDGPLGQDVTEPRVFAYSIAVVTLTAAAGGLLGSAAGSWLERRRGLRSSRAV